MGRSQAPGHVVEIEIYGTSYVIRGEGSPEEVRRAARLVDETMHQIAGASDLTDSLRVAVLAALHISDDYLTLRRKMGELEASLTGATTNCSNLLDEFLEEKG